MNNAGRGSWTITGKATQTRQYQYISGVPMDGTGTGEYVYCVRLGVKAIQNALNKLPSTSGLLSEDGIFGAKTAAAVKAAQIAWGLKSDGIAGTVFCSRLFRPLIEKSAINAGIEPKYLWGFVFNESGLDPGAQGYINSYDHGLTQINIQAHPDISTEQAHNPEFALPYTAKRFKEAMTKYSGKGADLQIKCAIAQHNSPNSAQLWYNTGYAPNSTIQTYVDRVLDYAAQW